MKKHDDAFGKIAVKSLWYSLKNLITNIKNKSNMKKDFKDALNIR